MNLWVDIYKFIYKEREIERDIVLLFRSVLFVGNVATITGAVDERGLWSRSDTIGVEVAHPVVC